MVKIPLSTEQIHSLLKWRDEHKDIVRSGLVPFPSCEILIENGIKIRIINDDHVKTIYHFTISNILTHEIKSKFNYSFLMGSSGMYCRDMSQDDLTSCVSVWATVMAYIVNFEPKIIKKFHEETESGDMKQRKTSPDRQKRPKNRVLYLNPIKFIDETKRPLERKYTPPACAFSVRGHYRHLKSGKLVYVHPYEKNIGKEKDENTKIVKIMEVYE